MGKVKNDGALEGNPAYDPAYAAIVYSGVAKGQKAGGPGNTYAEADASGIGFPHQDDLAAPPVPELGELQNKPYNQIKN